MTNYIHSIIRECFNLMCPRELAYAQISQSTEFPKKELGFNWYALIFPIEVVGILYTVGS